MGRMLIPKAKSGMLGRMSHSVRTRRGSICTCAFIRITLWCGVFRLAFMGVVAELPSFDFRKDADVRGWVAAHHISALEKTADGLRVTIDGNDPYFHGPPLNLPDDQPLWLRLRLKSEQGGMGQIFYFRDHASEERSVRFPVPAGEWHEVRLRLPALSTGYRLRIDPPGDRGECLFASLRIEARTAIAEPAWPRPMLPELGSNPLVVRSGDVELLHAGDAIGAFDVHVAGQRMASGQSQPLLGYVHNDSVRWIAFGHGPDAVVRSEVIEEPARGSEPRGETLRIEARFMDPDGGRWTVEQAFASAADGAIGVHMTVGVDAERDVIHLPWLTLLPGLGEYGTNKTQGLFAGLEYLENEPSSSTADLNPPASNRQVPDRIKLTFPLMAIAARDRYVGVTWEPGPETMLCAVFDSPDRFFDSGAHVMGLLTPGSDGVIRDESRLVPYEPIRIVPGQSFQVRAAILGGRGGTVVPAIQHYVRLQGLPRVPASPWTSDEYYALIARSWLDSKVREGNRYRHAVWPGFGPTPATDAAYQMRWLAERVASSELRQRLIEAARDAVDGLPPSALNDRQIGHVRYPVPALLHSTAAQAADHSGEIARQLLRRFESDGLVRYQARAGGVDYGRTHWSSDANGLTAQVVVSLLEAAVFSGDRALIADALRHLRAMTARYEGTVPRGAQTWEIALHTPDILAAAHLVRACVLGYELSGDEELLEEARYWAWTGVPFVYLTRPTSKPVGLYNTIAVLGATSWVAPIWIGQPVQWCGLVYADALYGLARHDADGPWQQLADGIAIGGMQHTWPVEDADRFGLLADYFLLRSQQLEGPAINPATVFLPAIRMWNEPHLYEFRALRASRLLVQVPGELTDVEETPERVSFRVRGWWPEPYELLLHGLSEAPSVQLNGRPSSETAVSFDPDAGRLILRVEGSPHVELTLHPGQEL
jgi:hypothetical protein